MQSAARLLDEQAPVGAIGSTPLVDADDGGRRSAMRDPLTSVGYVIDFTTDSGQSIRFKRPLKVEISPGEDATWTMYAPAVQVGGVGDSVDDAAQDLCESIWLLWLNLRDDSGPLDSSARDALVRLSAVMPE